MTAVDVLDAITCADHTWYAANRCAGADGVTQIGTGSSTDSIALTPTTPMTIAIYDDNGGSIAVSGSIVASGATAYNLYPYATDPEGGSITYAWTCNTISASGGSGSACTAPAVADNTDGTGVVDLSALTKGTRYKYEVTATAGSKTAVASVVLIPVDDNTPAAGALSGVLLS